MHTECCSIRDPSARAGARGPAERTGALPNDWFRDRSRRATTQRLHRDHGAVAEEGGDADAVQGAPGVGRVGRRSGRADNPTTES